MTELHYVLGNILRSDRYGAISSRLGKVKNTIAAIAFSDCELFSNLELTQTVYDLLKPEGADDLPFPLDDTSVCKAVAKAIDKLSANVFSQKPVFLLGDELEAELQGVAALYAEQDMLVQALKMLTDAHIKKAQSYTRK